MGYTYLPQCLCLLHSFACSFTKPYFSRFVWRVLLSWTRPDFRRDWKSAAAVSLAPLVGALLWGVTYELTKPAVPIYEVTHLRPQSALSALFYQYHSLEVFEVWTNDGFSEIMPYLLSSHRLAS